ncbi:hypothetical protein [Gordonia sputi]
MTTAAPWPPREGREASVPPTGATDSTRTPGAARRVTVGVDERRSSTSRPRSPRAHT